MNGNKHGVQDVGYFEYFEYRIEYCITAYLLKLLSSGYLRK